LLQIVVELMSFAGCVCPESPFDVDWPTLPEGDRSSPRLLLRNSRLQYRRRCRKSRDCVAIRFRSMLCQLP
jgi:hypothetical protein